MEKGKVRLVLIKPQFIGVSTIYSGSIVEVPELLGETLVTRGAATLLRGERLSQVLEPPLNAAVCDRPRRVKRLWKQLD